MKLLEILQKEIKQFPKEMLYAVQDGDGEVKFGKHLKPRLWSDGIWYRRESWDCLCITGLGLAEDWDSAIVTKDMWENGRVKSENSTQKVLGMTEKRKVRADFDKRKEYSVNVSNCTEVEKKKVQQAFFDAGFPWIGGHKEYLHLDAKQYTNTTSTIAGDEVINSYFMFGTNTYGCNMNPDEFFSYVYEPVQQGHIHAELMALYAEDAKTTDKPWKLWQIKDSGGEWWDLTCNPSFGPHLGYRRKPKTHTVNGFEVPTPVREELKVGDAYFTANTGLVDFYVECIWSDAKFNKRFLERGLVFLRKEDAIANAKAMLGIVPYGEENRL